jgi:hypothetical protein
VGPGRRGGDLRQQMTPTVIAAARAATAAIRVARREPIRRPMQTSLQSFSARRGSRRTPDGRAAHGAVSRLWAVRSSPPQGRVVWGYLVVRSYDVLASVSHWGARRNYRWGGAWAAMETTSGPDRAENQHRSGPQQWKKKRERKGEKSAARRHGQVPCGPELTEKRKSCFIPL